ncbi:MAG: methyltransferase domain-containing protein [Verrucomicrobia bacterium]|nr:methyltransferase domain-containing protein [Verrucomicrobiota bacterium]
MTDSLQRKIDAAPAQAVSSASGMTLGGVASHYDDLDKFYREIWGEHVHHGVWHTGKESDIEAAENLVTMVADAGQIGQGTRVCDIGCGYGATAKILAERRGAEVTGMTISEVQLSYAQEFNAVPGKTTFLLRDWYANQLPDESFDVVISIESLEHMPDLPKFFAEANRVLRPGGRLVASAWMSCENPGAMSRRFLIDAISREAQLAGIRPASEFMAAIKLANFSNASMDDLAKKVKRTWPLCAWRTIKGLLTKAHYRRFIFSSKNPNRIFALTLFRIWLAYNLGVMRYGFFTAEKPRQ